MFATRLERLSYARSTDVKSRKRRLATDMGGDTAHETEEMGQRTNYEIARILTSTAETSTSNAIAAPDVSQVDATNSSLHQKADNYTQDIKEQQARQSRLSSEATVKDASHGHGNVEALQEFLLFPKLSLELRLMIWKHAIDALPGNFILVWEQEGVEKLCTAEFPRSIDGMSLVCEAANAAYAAYLRSKTTLYKGDHDVSEIEVKIDLQKDELVLAHNFSFFILNLIRDGKYNNNAEEIRRIGIINFGEDIHGWEGRGGYWESSIDMSQLFEVFPNLEIIHLFPQRVCERYQPIIEEESDYCCTELCAEWKLGAAKEDIELVELNELESRRKAPLAIDAYQEAWEHYQTEHQLSGQSVGECPKILVMQLKKGPRNDQQRGACTCP